MYQQSYMGAIDHLYERPYALHIDLGKSIGKRFELGLLTDINFGDPVSVYIGDLNEERKINYSIYHTYKQQVYGLYGGILIQPIDRYLSHRMELSIQAGPALVRAYEHFDFSWNEFHSPQSGSYYDEGDHLIQKHYLLPGINLRLDSRYYINPGTSFSLAVSYQNIKALMIDKRNIPGFGQFGPDAYWKYRLDFSSLRLQMGVNMHF